MKLVIHADGGCVPNPGQMRIGLIVRDEHGALQHTVSKSIGFGTSNRAEWHALIEAYRYAYEQRATELMLLMDSRMVVEQANHRWRVKDAKLKPLAQSANVIYNELRRLPCQVHVGWVPREKNVEADSLT